MNVSNSFSNSPVLRNGPDAGKTDGSNIHSAHDFLEFMESIRPDPEKLRYNGSKERIPMTNDQVTELAKKYDPTNMTQKQYQEFLDDLVAMGRISQMEKEMMGYNAGVGLIGYVDEEGDFVSALCTTVYSDLSAAEEDFFSGSGGNVRLGFNGNLQKSLQVLNKCTYAKATSTDPDKNRCLAKDARMAEERRQVMTTVVENIMNRRRELGLTSGKAEASQEAEAPSLTEQASVPGGDFWVNLRNSIIENARENRKRAEEDAALELLDLILESMTGDEDSRRDAAAQLRLRALVNEVKQV